MKITLDGTVTLVSPTQEAKLDRMLVFIKRSLTLEKQIMATIEDLIEATAEQKTVIESLQTFVDGLQDQLNQAVTDLTPQQQAQIDEVFAGIKANTQEAAAAMTANTPQA
jgi:hypothetical protein